MGAVDFHGVEPRFFRPCSRTGEGADHVGDPLGTHRFAGLAEDGAGDGGGGFRDGAGRLFKSLPSRVVELERNLSAFPMDRRRQSGEAGEEGIAPRADLVRECLASRIDGADFGDDEPRASLCPPCKIGDQAVADRAVGISVAGPHCRHHGAVLQCHAVDRDGGKETFQFHNTSRAVASGVSRSRRFGMTGADAFCPSDHIHRSGGEPIVSKR